MIDTKLRVQADTYFIAVFTEFINLLVGAVFAVFAVFIDMH